MNGGETGIATTRIIALHKNRGKSVAKCLADRTDYIKNSDKTKNQELISAYKCDPHTADAEFLLSKRQYRQITGREQGSDVIAYQIRQSFKPGEVTPEQANEIGYELAMRFLKGKHAFLVCTHVDKKHIHSHIIFNSTSLDCTQKFRDFLGSGRAVGRLSDIICLEHGLSIIENPRRYTHSTYDKWLGDQAKPSQREAVLAGEKHHSPKKRRDLTAPQKNNLLIDIDAKLREGKGAGYERWAKVHNLKQMAQTVNYLREHGLLDYDDLVRKTADASARFEELSEKIKTAEKRMVEIAVLKTHIINYSKTREVYVAYRKSGYSKKFLAEHEGDIVLHKAAKKAFDELGLKKLPAVKGLQAEYAELLAQKKLAYADYRTARDEKRELLIHKANVEKVLGKEPVNEEKKNEHNRG